MTFRYALIAAVLAGGILSAPAMAGVTGAGDGHITDTTTTKRAETYIRHEVSKDITGSTFNTTNVTASYNVHGANTASGSISRTLNGSFTDASVQAVIADMKNTVQTDALNVSGRTASTGWSSSSSNTSSKIYHPYSDWTSQGATEKLTDVTSKSKDSGSGAWVVGDMDALSSAYAAKGDYTRETVITDHVQVDETFLRTRVVDTQNTTAYAVNFSRLVSPIVLDLNRDGKIDASNGKYLPHGDSMDETHLTMFDFAGNGFPVMTEWVGANDGLLCRPNADGSVNGTNLFGTSNGYANGYDELSSLDADKNGVLEGSELDGLMVWVDADGRATASPEELHSLQSLGITSIGVTHDNMRGSFVMNGENCTSVDWWPSIMDVRKVDMAKR